MEANEDMKTANKLLTALCLALIACLAMPALLPAGVNGPFGALAATRISKTKATIYNGTTLQLKITGTGKPAKWSSSNAAVAKVDQKGLVTANKVGKATITAQIGKEKYSCKVTVKSALSANVQQLTLDVGTTQYITLIYRLSGKLFLKQYDSSVLSCSLGKLTGGKCTLTVKALRPGTQTLLVTNSKTDDTVRIQVTVRGHEDPTDTIVDRTRVTVAVDKTATVKVTWSYEDIPHVWWDDSSVVSCSWGQWDNDGWPLYIKGVGKGVATVWFTRGDDYTEEALATIKVTVK